MAFLFIALGWVGYVAWVMRSRESSRQAHLVVAWALLALGVLLELVIPLLLRSGG
jgi:hypothetical protein